MSDTPRPSVRTSATPPPGAPPPPSAHRKSALAAAMASGQIIGTTPPGAPPPPDQLKPKPPDDDGAGAAALGRFRQHQAGLMQDLGQADGFADAELRSYGSHVLYRLNDVRYERNVNVIRNRLNTELLREKAHQEALRQGAERLEARRKLAKVTRLARLLGGRGRGISTRFMSNAATHNYKRAVHIMAGEFKRLVKPNGLANIFAGSRSAAMAEHAVHRRAIPMFNREFFTGFDRMFGARVTAARSTLLEREARGASLIAGRAANAAEAVRWDKQLDFMRRTLLIGAGVRIDPKTVGVGRTTDAQLQKLRNIVTDNKPVIFRPIPGERQAEKISRAMEFAWFKPSKAMKADVYRKSIRRGVFASAYFRDKDHKKERLDAAVTALQEKQDKDVLLDRASVSLEKPAPENTMDQALGASENATDLDNEVTSFQASFGGNEFEP